GSRLEPRRDAEIIGARIHWLPLRQPRHHLRWPVPHAGVSHVDEGAVVRFQRNADILFQDAIGTEKQPVSPVGEDLSTQARTFERAPDGRKETPHAAWRRADVTRWYHNAD